MCANTFIANVNKAKSLIAILLKKTLLIEIKPVQQTSFYIELSSNGARKVYEPIGNVHFVLEGRINDIEEVLLNAVSLKQSISFGKIQMKGSYRDYLRLEAIIKLS
ncbi:SCP2 sterol-binding domain-containing protein [Metabacillus niabensis]|uniref:SCP2 domain-containing protein n=1 Tax=Metabacillus niabensis TaxID=324854 RepID=A0ABT9YZP7_9BACI|nr:SCP2 sterol-binding domain-containing protein [Metabacillus niabensis]MDQ0225477.1 hypothetical protein [Metabacillus niabensis]PAD70933.1 hypothetical protein CHH83_00980 [Bacillus sp. 7586-K]